MTPRLLFACMVVGLVALCAPAVMQVGARDRVLVVTVDGRVESRDVEVERYVEALFAPIDPLERQWAVLRKGLQAGEQVIVTNVHMLPPGTSVRSVDRALAHDGSSPAGSVTP